MRACMKASGVCVKGWGFVYMWVCECVRWTVLGDFPNEMERVKSVRLFPGVDK